jgi:hypothetical protein
MSEERRKRKQERENPPEPGRFWRKILIALIIVAALAGVYFVGYYRRSHRYDSFAQCLTDRKVKMYGLYWCPHCADQEQLFGASFAHVNYVECGLPGRRGEQPQCLEAGVKQFPTWEFADGERQSRVIPLAELGQKTGCTLP